MPPPPRLSRLEVAAGVVLGTESPPRAAPGRNRRSRRPARRWSARSSPSWSAAAASSASRAAATRPPSSRSRPAWRNGSACPSPFPRRSASRARRAPARRRGRNGWSLTSDWPTGFGSTRATSSTASARSRPRCSAVTACSGRPTPTSTCPCWPRRREARSSLASAATTSSGRRAGAARRPSSPGRPAPSRATPSGSVSGGRRGPCAERSCAGGSSCRSPGSGPRRSARSTTRSPPTRRGSRSAGEPASPGG